MVYTYIVPTIKQCLIMFDWWSSIKREAFYGIAEDKKYRKILREQV